MSDLALGETLAARPDPDAATPGAGAADAWASLRALGLTAGDAFAGRGDELRALRDVAAADLGLARILDGHRNGLERILAHRPGDVPAAERAAAASGAVPYGVWGADPRDGEGPPAMLDAGDGVVRGVKTWCSGAGLVERALVLVRAAPDGPPDRVVLLDASDPATVEVDRTWFAGEALRSSASHRVVLHDAPVLATLGGPGALLEEPWFAGDALRTTATWAGALDAVAHDALRTAGGATVGEAAGLLAGRLAAAHATVDRWLDHAVSSLDRGDADPARTVLLARIEITERAREVLRLAAELGGSHPIATASPAARSRRDLDLLLLQHRLTPATVRLGRRLLGDAR